ncbi:MAG: Mov34/MPN/PAD-1 family protein [Candidatus Bathyarchaeota archaeon]|nr:Mov34/MPN/PAD-1 family protein [Candidatus Bathyarchaeota archaeon]
MEILVDKGLLEEMLSFARDRHPKEAILMLRGKVTKESITLTDYLFPPFATTDSVSASYPIHMLPIDFSIVGTVHSHPSGSLNLSTQDINHMYGRFSMLMVFPYGLGDVAAFNKQGERLVVRVTD